MENLPKGQSYLCGQAQEPLLYETIGACVDRIAATHGDREALVNYQLSSMAYWNNSKEMLNRWTGAGSTNNPRHPRMNAKDSHNTRISSRYVEDGSFLRIQNVQLGYTLPESVVSKLKLASLRVYVSGQNLYTFTEYTGYDPEVGGYGTAIGLDRATYPIPRTITFGMNLSF